MRTRTVTFAGNTIRVNVCQDLIDYWDCRAWLEAQPSTVFGLDVETTGLDMFGPDFAVRMVQLSDGEVAWLLPVNPRDHTFGEVKSLLNHPELKVATHTQYDVNALFQHLGVDMGQRVVDTHLLARMVNPAGDAEHGLKHLATEFLRAPELAAAADLLHARFRELAKAQGENALARSPKKLIGWGFANIDLEDEAFEVYAALDAVAAAWLAPALVGPLTSTRNLVGMEMWLAAVCTSMRRAGMRVDRDYTESILSTACSEIEQAEDTIRSLTGLDSARSPKRVEWLLGKGVVFDQEAVTETGKPSLAKDHLPPLVQRYAGTEAGTVLTAIHTISDNSNLKANLQGFLDHADVEDRVHPEIKTLQARTARMSVTNPAMQTLSKSDPRLRGCFVADEGMTLVSVDFSQVEARVAAALSGDKALAAPILAGEDLHSDTARRIWGEGFTPEQRQLAKIVNFGSIYGGGAGTLAKQAGISLGEAQKVVAMWRETYPGLVGFSADLATRKFVRTPTGRVLPVDPERPYAALNYMVQSTSRDLLVLAVHRIIHRLGIPVDALWMLVHDEVVLQVPDHLAEQVALEVQEVMATTLYGIPIVAEAEVLGKRWAK